MRLQAVLAEDRHFSPLGNAQTIFDYHALTNRWLHELIWLTTAPNLNFTAISLFALYFLLITYSSITACWLPCCHVRLNDIQKTSCCYEYPLNKILLYTIQRILKV